MSSGKSLRLRFKGDKVSLAAKKLIVTLPRKEAYGEEIFGLGSQQAKKGRTRE